MAKIKKKTEETAEPKTIIETTSAKENIEVVTSDSEKGNPESTVTTAEDIIITPSEIVETPETITQTTENVIETIKDDKAKKNDKDVVENEKNVVSIENNKPQRVKYSTKGMFGYDWLGVVYD